MIRFLEFHTEFRTGGISLVEILDTSNSELNPRYPSSARGEDRMAHGAGNAPRPDVHPASHDVDVTPGIYLRAAQAYMLISMPTGTSTIFGAFQAIVSLLG